MVTMTTNKLIVSLLFVAGVTRVAVAAPQELGSPIRIAQCRAQCLQKFVENDRHESLCQQDPDCFTCWENCGLLQDNPTRWIRICNQPSVCFPGCMQACQFFQNGLLLQKDPVMPSSAEPTVKLSGTLATWPRPSIASKRDRQRLVYAVIQKQPSGRWRQIIQTAEERCFLPTGETPSSVSGSLRVLVVSGEGLVALYRPEYEDSDVGLVESLPESDAVIETSAPSSAGAPSEIPIDSKLPVSSQWKLREVSLIHQKVLVIAEVAWPSQKSPDGKTADYLVTWEVDGGGLKGHLYTDSTSVTLSLWPETVYHIQVELVMGADSVQLRSSPLTIDTHKAPVVTGDERILPASPLVNWAAASSGSNGSRRLEATVGVGAAAGISLCLLVLATAIGIRRHQQALLRRNAQSGFSSVEDLTDKMAVLVKSAPRTVKPEIYCSVHTCWTSQLQPPNNPL